MAEYTKIETAMAIICDRCEDLYLDDFCPEKRNLGKCGWRRYLEKDATYVAPVVRCRDCKYWQNNNDDYPHEECQWGNGETPNANDFCSYGERKDAANVAPVVHGRWIEQEKYTFGVMYDCSICGNRILDNGHSCNYCPNCGARMDGGSENG